MWFSSESTGIQITAFSFRLLSTYLFIIHFLFFLYNSSFNQHYGQKYVFKTQNPDHKSQTIRTSFSCIKHLTITKMYNQSVNEQRREPLRPIAAPSFLVQNGYISEMKCFSSDASLVTNTNKICFTEQEKLQHTDNCLVWFHFLQQNLPL